MIFTLSNALFFSKRLSFGGLSESNDWQRFTSPTVQRIPHWTNPSFFLWILGLRLRFHCSIAIPSSATFFGIKVSLIPHKAKFLVWFSLNLGRPRKSLKFKELLLVPFPSFAIAIAARFKHFRILQLPSLKEGRIYHSLWDRWRGFMRGTKWSVTYTTRTKSLILFQIDGWLIKLATECWNFSIPDLLHTRDEYKMRKFLSYSSPPT